jgi:SAM-dependent methyltransferase
MSLVVMNDPREESYGQHELTWVDRVGVWLSKRAILRHLPRRTELEVLDLGCGYDATLLRALLPKLAAGIGVDVRVSDRAKGTPKLAFMESSLEEALPALNSLQFDLVLLISVLEHLWDPLRTLRECYRVLKHDGLLLVNVPTWRGKFFLEFSAFRLGMSPAIEMEDHKMYYDKRDLWPLLIRAGFKPSKIRAKYHKLGLNLFAAARKSEEGGEP